MKILYLGDIMGRPGREVVKVKLPGLRLKHKIDLVIAQAENISHGKGLSPAHFKELQAAGVDFFSGGNHTIERAATKLMLADPSAPVIAPINQKGIEPAWGAKLIDTQQGPVLVASLLGTIFPTDMTAGNALTAADELLETYKNKPLAAIIVNFHGDLSSEKRVIGYYLDGRVSAVLGDHWHVPSADAMILPRGTAHMTDVGMCGTLHSSLGVSKETIIARWRDGAKVPNDIAEGPPYQLNGALLTIDTGTRLATKIEPINLVFEELG